MRKTEITESKNDLSMNACERKSVVVQARYRKHKCPGLAGTTGVTEHSLHSSCLYTELQWKKFFGQRDSRSDKI